MSQIFISYSRLDRPFAIDLRDALEGRGYQVWLDQDDIRSGEKWSKAIQRGLESSALLLLILSPDAMASNNVEDEWQYFLDHGKPVIPVYWRECTKHFQLNRLQHVDFRPPIAFEAAMTKLVAELTLKGILASAPPSPSSSASNDRIIVARTGRADYRSINEALKNAPEGVQIIVRPGVYTESVTLTQAVEIIGEGDPNDIILEHNTKHPLRMATNYAVVKGLSIRFTNPLKQLAAVYIPKGRLHLSNCNITSRSKDAAAMDISGRNADPKIQNCLVHDSSNGGVVFYDGAQGLVEDCRMLGNQLSGVTIRGKANPILHGCHMEGNQRGLLVSQEGQGLIEDCHMVGNRLSGVQISEKANPTLRRCTIQGNAYEAVYVHTAGYGMVEDCDLRGNAGGARRIEGDSSVTRRNNQE